MSPRILAGIFAATLVSLAAAEPPAALLQSCAECHGRDGLATRPGLPHLDGQMDVYFVESLRAFGKGTRRTAIAQHRNVGAEDAQALAAHYMGQKASRRKSTTDPDLVARGESIYQNRCADCHFDSGREADKDAPLLAAQDLDYLIAQTTEFRTGARSFPFMMDGAYKGLTEADLTAVAHFFAAQDQVAPAVKRRKKRQSGP